MSTTSVRPAGFTPREAAEQLSISRSHLYNLISRGEIRVVKVGRRTVVPAVEIDRVLEHGTDSEAQ